ncbi:MFS transporter [Paenarthrobacter sp. PH39-S1]|uniref:MFS transporter n=1 Tax=Paenarthrobacter sp. PH39-S1 TaxID=3046204 RepID=UPI0024BAF68E|nr:MFS transporter [Paenarthrobacter sp. PH39-S1]MDJ0357423.1 MFS transporter [Paenarthrobacter sp. PH39-S1]
MTAERQSTVFSPRRRHLFPLYAAGFTTAFGAHAVAANLGAYSAGHGQSLLLLGLMLALYDGAEVLLKPVFGTLSDRIGARPVLLGGLVAFALFSAAFVLARDAAWLWLARLGQGAAASAFSPAASSLVSRLNPAGRQGRAFGTYGFYKSVGYTAGPLIGGALVAAGGLDLLFTLTALLALAVGLWAFLAVPVVAPLPRARQSVADLARRLGDRGFLAPTAALAAATAALSVGVGFLPLSGAAAGLGPVATGAAVSLLAVCAAVAQPLAGRASDTPAGPGRLVGLGLALTAAGLAAAMLPGIPGLLAAAVGIGAGTGIITPVAFAALAAATPPERLGQTMGTAEIGRELGDAGGPLLVGVVAAAVSLTAGYGALALLTAVAAVSFRRRPRTGGMSPAAVKTSPTRTEPG